MRLTAGLNARSVLAMTFMVAPLAPHTRRCFLVRCAGARRLSLQSRNEIGHAFVFHFEARPIDDQASGRSGDKLHFDQIMSLQRLPAGNEVHNAIGQSNEGGEFDGAIQLDDLNRYPLLIKIAFGDIGIFRCHPDF